MKHLEKDLPLIQMEFHTLTNQKATEIISRFLLIQSPNIFMFHPYVNLNP